MLRQTSVTGTLAQRLPWARAREVAMANGGDLLKEAELIAAETADPESPPLS